MKKEPMKKLEQFNKARSKWIMENAEGKADPMLNGIACPDCGEELFDTKPLEVTAGTPPGKEVHCGKKDCEFTGERVA